MVSDPDSRREARHDNESALLTAMQQAVVELVAGGLPNAAIADRLGCSVKSVENQLFKIYSALDLNVMPSQIGKRIRLATWWATRHGGRWCEDCPVHPVLWQEDRVRPPRKGENLTRVLTIGHYLHAIPQPEYQGQCQSPWCDNPVIGYAIKQYCNPDCRRQTWLRVKHGYRIGIERPCKNQACPVPITGRAGQIFCSTKCKNTVWSALRPKRDRSNRNKRQA